MLNRRNNNPISSCSKASRGLFVQLRVSGIFTGLAISPSCSLRQFSSRYAIRAGRNLHDKEFRLNVLLLMEVQSFLPHSLCRHKVRTISFPKWDLVCSLWGVQIFMMIKLLPECTAYHNYLLTSKSIFILPSLKAGL